MLAKRIAALAAVVLMVGTAFAAEKEVTGKITKIDDKGISIEVDGKEVKFAIAKDTKLVDAKGKDLKDGPADKRIAVGADIKLTVDVVGKKTTVKELALTDGKAVKKDPVAKETPKKEAPKDTPKETPKKEAPKDTPKETPKKETPKETPKKDPVKKDPVVKKDPPTKEGELRDDWPKIEGTLAKIAKVDLEKLTASVVFADGKKGELKLNDMIQFSGPRGGKADMKDERFAEGRTIKIVYDATGKTVKAIHLQVIRKEDTEEKK